MSLVAPLPRDADETIVVLEFDDGHSAEVGHVHTTARHAVLVDLVGELSTEFWLMFAVRQIGDATRLLAGGAS